MYVRTCTYVRARSSEGALSCEAVAGVFRMIYIHTYVRTYTYVRTCTQGWRGSVLWGSCWCVSYVWLDSDRMWNKLICVTWLSSYVTIITHMWYSYAMIIRTHAHVRLKGIGRVRQLLMCFVRVTWLSSCVTHLWYSYAITIPVYPCVWTCIYMYIICHTCETHQQLSCTIEPLQPYVSVHTYVYVRTHICICVLRNLPAIASHDQVSGICDTHMCLLCIFVCKWICMYIICKYRYIYICIYIYI